MSLFVDTSALLALLDADDPEHERAKTAWDEFAEERTSLVSTNFVVVETVSVGATPTWDDAVRALVDDILPVIEIRFVDAAVHHATIATLLAASRRQLSLVVREFRGHAPWAAAPRICVRQALSGAEVHVALVIGQSARALLLKATRG